MFDVVESEVVIRGFAGDNFTKQITKLYQVYNLCIAIYVDYVPVLCLDFEMYTLECQAIGSLLLVCAIRYLVI